MRRIVDIVRAFWQFSAGWLFCVLFMPLLVGIVALVPGDRDRLATPMIRAWARVLLAICGVKLVLQNPEAMLGGGRRVLVINHSSTLDLVIACAAWPQRGSGVLKKEFLQIPVLGWASRMLGQISVDRSSTEAALASMAQAAATMKREDRAVIIAPEGTRSATGELGRFKVGGWHLARDADAPLVPLVLYGPSLLWPRAQLSCRSGTVTVRALPAIYPAEQQPAAFRASADALRERYVQHLKEMADTLGPP
jgi:1-acyl-sn-glycerol-3-phosphate acyltransferase